VQHSIYLSLPQPFHILVEYQWILLRHFRGATYILPFYIITHFLSFYLFYWCYFPADSAKQTKGLHSPAPLLWILITHSCWVSSTISWNVHANTRFLAVHIHYLILLFTSFITHYISRLYSFHLLCPAFYTYITLQALRSKMDTEYPNWKGSLFSSFPTAICRTAAYMRPRRLLSHGRQSRRQLVCQPQRMHGKQWGLSNGQPSA
jgi:hypothetical protein